MSTEGATRLSRRAVLAATACLWLTAGGILAWAAFSVRLNGDVQYVLGGLSAAGEVGWSDTFVHRPLAYRAILSAINVIAGAIAPVADRPIVYETAVRGLAWLAAGGAGVLVWYGLRRTIDPRLAVTAAAAAVLALIFAPQWDSLQGEWLAALLTTAAVGATLSTRRPAVGGVAGGLLLTAAAGTKLVTAALVPAGILLVFLINPRRTWPLALGTGAWGIALAVVTVLHPKELMWTLDMAALNASLATDVPAAARGAVLGLVDKAIVTPSLLLAPAASMMLLRLAPRTQRRRVAWSIAALGLLAAAPMLAQARFTAYHAAPLSVAASVLVAVAACQWWIVTRRPPWIILLCLVAAAIASTLTLATPADTRLGWLGAIRLGAVALALAAALAAALASSRQAVTPGRLSRPSIAVGVIGLLAFVPAMAPDTAWNVGGRGSERTNATWSAQSVAQHQNMRELSTIIGRDTPVMYVGYGDIPYHMGNPTDCPYPSPLWLQRGTAVPAVRSLPSYADNRRCFDATDADILVFQPGWTVAGPSTTDLFDDLGLFDCRDPVSRAGVQACPRVSDGP